MARAFISVVMLSALVSIGSLASQREEQSQQVDGSTRTVMASRGASLRAQIGPSDRFIRVVSTQTMPLLVLPPAGMTQLDWMMHASGGAWLVRLTEASSRLTEDGDFVETDISATVLETFKEPEGFAFNKGDVIPFTVSGGETTVDGVVLRAMVPWIRQPQLNQVYILFGDKDPQSGALVVNATGLYERGELGFSSLLQQGPWSGHKLDGSPTQTLNAIRAASRR